MNGYVTIGEAAEMLGVTPGRVRQMVVPMGRDTPELPSEVMGNMRIILRREVTRLKRKRRQRANGK